MTGVPDLTPYVDLTLDDRTAQDLIEGFLADLASRMGIVPNELNPTVIWGEAVAAIDAELIFSYNRLPGALLEALGTVGYQLPRSQGTRASGTVAITLSDAAGHMVPAGTRLAILAGDGNPAGFTTDTDLYVAAGDTTGAVTVTADIAGVALNGIPAGTNVAVLDSIPWLDSATLTVATADGTDPEAGESYVPRLSALLQRQTATLQAPSQFALAALSVPGIGRATAVDRYDLYTATADVNGHITIVIGDAAGAPVDPAVAAAFTTYLESGGQGGGSVYQAGLVYHLADPTQTAVDVTAAVQHDFTLDDATAIANVTAALAAYLSPGAWPWAGTVYVTELEYVARAVPGITRAIVTLPAGDVALAGLGPLAAAGAITVTIG